MLHYLHTSSRWFMTLAAMGCIRHSPPKSLHVGLSTLSLHFNGHFPGEPRLAGVYWSKGWWRWWWQLDYWRFKSCKAPVKSSPPTKQHPVFLQAGCPSCCPTSSVKALKEKYHNPWTCLPQAHLGIFQLCLWTLIAPGYLGEVAIPLNSHLMPVPYSHTV